MPTGKKNKLNSSKSTKQNSKQPLYEKIPHTIITKPLVEAKWKSKQTHLMS
jgi:hypothetical protein